MGYSFKEPVRKQNKMAKFLNSKKVVPYVFVSPFLISFLILTFYPTIQAFIMSFQKILPGEVSFIGLSNYERIFNSTFYQALTNTTIYMILTVVILVTIPIILAVLLDSKVVKLKNIFRSALFISNLYSKFLSNINKYNYLHNINFSNYSNNNYYFGSIIRFKSNKVQDYI